MNDSDRIPLAELRVLLTKLQQLYTNMDARIAGRLKRDARVPSCQKGCDSCCKIMIGRLWAELKRMKEDELTMWNLLVDVDNGNGMVDDDKMFEIRRFVDKCDPRCDHRLGTPKKK